MFVVLSVALQFDREENKAALDFYKRLGFEPASAEFIEQVRLFYPATIETGVEWAPSYGGDAYYARYVTKRPTY